MAATVNRIPAVGISVGQEVSALAERLRKSVVRVGGEGPGSGSGVIWSADGLIVTNAHVATAERLRAELADGRRLEAQLIARDPRRDLALLKVNAADWLRWNRATCRACALERQYWRSGIRWEVTP